MDFTSFLINLCLVALGRIVWSIGVQWRVLSDWEEHGRAEAEGSWPRWIWHREHLNCLAVCTHFRGFGLAQASGLCSVYMLTSLALFCETLDECTWNPLCNKNSLLKKKSICLSSRQKTSGLLSKLQETFGYGAVLPCSDNRWRVKGLEKLHILKEIGWVDKEEKFNSFLLIYLLVTSLPDHVV